MLRETVADWHAKPRRRSILDPRTGDVLALAQAPGYNANDANRVPFAIQRNRTVTDMFEPGSTFKLVTIAGALSQKIVTPSPPSACRTRSMSPTGSSTTPSTARPSR